MTREDYADYKVRKRIRYAQNRIDDLEKDMLDKDLAWRKEAEKFEAEQRKLELESVGFDMVAPPDEPISTLETAQQKMGPKANDGEKMMTIDEAISNLKQRCSFSDSRD